MSSIDAEAKAPDADVVTQTDAANNPAASEGGTADVGDDATNGEAQTKSSQRSPRRPPPSNAQLDKISANAKETFAKQYQGATLSMPTLLKNYPVVRWATRIYAPTLRNWNTCMTILRTVLQDAAGALSVERGLLEHIGKQLGDFEKEKARLDAVLADIPEVDTAKKSLTWQNPRDERLPIIGPVAFKLRQLFLSCDEILDLAMVAYTLEVIDAGEHEKLRFKVKRALKSVDSLARNTRVQVLQRTRDAGITRPGYKSGEAEDPKGLQLAA